MLAHVFASAELKYKSIAIAADYKQKIPATRSQRSDAGTENTF
jgi:hypothetical protein